MIKEIYHYNDERLRGMVVNFLYNLNRDKIESGRANITEDTENNLIYYREI